MSEGCLEHNECMGQIATRLVKLEGYAERSDERMVAIEDRLEQVLSTERPPCNKVAVLEGKIETHSEQIGVLNDFKDEVIGTMATQATMTKTMQGDVSEVKGDVKILLKSDIRKTIYWGIAITVLMIFVNFGIPLIVAKLKGN